MLTVISLLYMRRRALGRDWFFLRLFKKLVIPGNLKYLSGLKARLAMVASTVKMATTVYDRQKGRGDLLPKEQVNRSLRVDILVLSVLYGTRTHVDCRLISGSWQDFSVFFFQSCSSNKLS